MLCTLCKSKKLKNCMTEGTSTFKTSTLIRHIGSPDHKQDLVAPSASNMEQAVEKVFEKEEKGISVAIICIYWLANEGIPLTKYSSLVTLRKHLECPI